MADKRYRNIITARKWTKENIILALAQTNEKDHGNSGYDDEYHYHYFLFYQATKPVT